VTVLPPDQAARLRAVFEAKTDHDRRVALLVVLEADAGTPQAAVLSAAILAQAGPGLVALLRGALDQGAQTIEVARGVLILATILGGTPPAVGET
jgi:hypothetical protein